MGRKNRRKHRSNNIRSNTVKQLCRLYSEGSFTSGAATVALNPSAFPQALEIADTYAFYRVTKLRFRLYRIASLSVTQVAAFVAGVTDNAPSNSAVAALIPHCAILPLSATVPSPWQNIPRSVLMSYMPWLKSIVGSPDPAEETQGNIYIRGAGAEQYAIEIEAVFEFRDILSTSITPAERGRLESLAERDRILRLLGSTPLAAAASPQSK